MPIKYIPYYPNTVEGQAILNNITRFQRLLQYRENDKVFERIKRGLPLYEVEEVENVGNNNENLVIRGECLSACAYLKSNDIKVDLVYIDPPFASGADYAKKVFIRKNPKVADLIQSNTNEMEIEELRSFEEKMYGDIWQKEDYLNWMYENLVAIKQIMSETGSIYVHLDWHIGHYVKILMDEVFGEDYFRNEIAYGYRIQGINQSNWPRKHDTIFYYSKSNEWIFNPEKEIVIYEKPFIDTKKTEPDLSKLTDKEKSEISRCVAENTPLPDKYKQKLFNKYYSEVFVRDIWDADITKPIISGSSESVGYSTQKSEGLLTRIINASSNEGMIVADFFGGSGVAAKVAHSLGRKFIHVDIGINSIQTVRDRLVESGAEFKIFEIKDGVSLFRNPQQSMDKIASIIPGFQKNNSGLGDFWFGVITEARLGTIPVYVPNLLNTQEKVLDIPTINIVLNQELHTLPPNIKKVILYYIDTDEIDLINKFIRENNSTQIDIELRDLKNLLHEIIIQDVLDFDVIKKPTSYVVEIKKIISDRLINKIQEFNDKGNLQSISKGKKFEPIIISDAGLELIEYVSIDCENSEGPWHSSSEIKIDKLGYVIKDGIETSLLWDSLITCHKKPLRMKVRNISGDETIVHITNAG